MKMYYISNIAKRKNGDEDWQPFSFKVIGKNMEDTLVTGGIAKIVKTGRNKGKFKWNKDCIETQEIVTQAEYEAEVERYEKETGNCAECLGRGETLNRITKSIEGNTYIPQYKTCKRCNGGVKI